MRWSRFDCNHLLSSLALAACLALPMAGLAGEVTLERGQFVAGGGLASSGGNVVLSGSIGSHDGSGYQAFYANEFQSSGVLTLTSGFWRGAAFTGFPDLTGNWFDPTTDGQGFNLKVTSAGLLGYFFGYDENDEQLWLALNPSGGEFAWGEPITLPAITGDGGVFGDPSNPAQGEFVNWGTVELTFHSCGSAEAVVSGLSGTQSLELVRLTGVAGLAGNRCADPSPYDGLADLTGPWFDPATNGQGWNFIYTPIGLAGKFYGYRANGEQLWLVITNPIASIEKDEPVEFNLSAASGGSFGNPVPPADWFPWGTLTLTFHSCREATAEIDGLDGSQTQDLVMLIETEHMPDCGL